MRLLWGSQIPQWQAIPGPEPCTGKAADRHLLTYVAGAQVSSKQGLFEKPSLIWQRVTPMNTDCLDLLESTRQGIGRSRTDTGLYLESSDRAEGPMQLLPEESI